jgi:2',3'-cyclic-nucleotide 2'-phosphodiesterase (5'-nucleotidase family)
MQPDALSATNDPKGPLTWGEVNVLHTTDIHGWLEGHIKERNYGADWGDFISFVRHMNNTAKKNKRDLLVVDTGRLTLLVTTGGCEANQDTFRRSPRGQWA